MSNTRPNLASAFAPAAPRGAKLEGMLAPKRRKPEGSVEPRHIAVVSELADASDSVLSPEETTTVDPSTTGRASESAEASSKSATQGSQAQQTRKTSTRSRSKASDSVPGALRNVGVYLAPELLATVKEALYSQRSTYADLLLDAFEALSDDTIAREFKQETIPSSSGMPRRAPRRRGQAGIQIQVRLDGVQTAWLDEKVVEFDAPSRSALVSTVYRLHLAKN